MKIELNWYVYQLIDPETNEVRYIGCCKDPEKRKHQHTSNRELSYNNKKSKWMESLKKKGIRPLMEVLAGFQYEMPAKEFERSMIRACEYTGIDLLNTMKFKTTTKMNLLNKRP